MAKIRAGFVSNSSSSSFIIGVKPGAKLTVDKLMELFKIPSDSPLYEMNKEIAGCLIRRMELTSIEDLLGDYGYESLEDAKEQDGYYERSDLAVMEKHAGMEMYRGYVSNEDGGVEAMLCDATINIATPDILIKKEGGY